jgi:hypothetical protein
MTDGDLQSMSMGREISILKITKRRHQGLGKSLSNGIPGEGGQSDQIDTKNRKFQQILRAIRYQV